MAKFALLLLALVAVQGCYGASLGSPKLNDLEEVVGDIAVAMKDIQEIISYIAKHLSPVSSDYVQEINEIMEKRPVYPIIADLRTTIYKLESESNEESKNCFSDAWMTTTEVTEEMKINIDTCISEAHATGGHIKSILETVDGKASRIQVELVDGFHRCMQEGNLNREAVQCLRDVIEPLKEQIVSVKTEVGNAYDDVHKDVQDGTRNLNFCLQQLTKDVSSKSENILESLNQCIKKDNVSFAKPASRGILDFIRELKEKIEYIINIMSHLPTSIAEIPDKINEIISHINISAIYSQLKTEVHDIIENGGSDAEKCRPEADEKLNSIIKNAEDTSKTCMAATEGKVEEVEAELAALVAEAKTLLADVNNQINDCILENKLNPIGLVRCLESNADGFKARLSVLQKRVSDTIETAKEQAGELLETLASCANKVQLDTINQGQALIADVEKCIRNSHFLF